MKDLSTTFDASTSLEIGKKKCGKKHKGKKSNTTKDKTPSIHIAPTIIQNSVSETEETPPEITNKRPVWGNSTEFLMSCIAMSVGLGNIWRFPLTAYENGGGAFIIPYIAVLILVGTPMYYLEAFLGQFSGRNSIRIWAIAPVLTGVGFGQLVAAFLIVSYYVALMGLITYYFTHSFSKELPWTLCKPEWGSECYSSSFKHNRYENLTQNIFSSSEMYYTKEVLRQVDTISEGIGYPDWSLSVNLFFSWLGVFFVMRKGVKSAGKASYFMAIFPYVILIVLMVKACTLKGALNGIKFFVYPNWHQLYNPQVWYAAVTQVFFSLTVCIGAITMYSSFNQFRQNIFRTVVTVVTLDTFASLLAGFTIFGILGNLAHQKNITEIHHVIGSGGISLAFISYPDAIAKFDSVPQLFSVLFFSMLWVLGLGSAVSYQSAIVTVLSDRYKNACHENIALATCIVTFLFGLLYVTPEGQHILSLVDYFGGTFLILALSIAELIGINWVYGLENLCEDVEFMTGKPVNIYWRWCWGLVTPIIMIIVFCYAIGNHKVLTYMNNVYPVSAYAAGWGIFIFGIIQIPLWTLIVYIRKRSSEVLNTRSICCPSSGWGPKESKDYQAWMIFKDIAKRNREAVKVNTIQHWLHSLNGTYRKYELVNDSAV